MKSIFRLFTALFLLIAASQATHAQIAIRIRPERPRIVRIAAPTARHIWIDEEWEWRNNGYVYTGGRWALPPAGYVRWVPGHWKQNRRAQWVWKPGHWV